MKEIGRRLQRLLGKPAALESAQWCLVEFETMSGTRRAVHVCCPNCGVAALLGPEFTVLPYSGLVTPRWRCGGCALVERLELESYDAA